MRLRYKIAGLALAAGTILGVGTVSDVSAAPVTASAPSSNVEVVGKWQTLNGVSIFLPAHQFGIYGPVHNHVGVGCLVSPVNCFRWITADGTVWQGDYGNLVGQYNYVLVWCSSARTATSNGNWTRETSPWGPYGNIGANHPYCASPQYGTPLRPWSVRGTWQTS